MVTQHIPIATISTQSYFGDIASIRQPNFPLRFWTTFPQRYILHLEPTSRFRLVTGSTMDIEI